jgi:hypothetical protein
VKIHKKINSIHNLGSSWGLVTTIIKGVGPRHILSMAKGKNKVVPVLKPHAMNGYGGVEVQLHTLLTSVLDGGEKSSSHPTALTSENNDYEAGWAPEDPDALKKAEIW